MKIDVKNSSGKGVESIKLDSKITHIILENGDTLVKNSVLKENFKLVFNNNTGQIWERAIHHNNLYQ